MSTCDPTVDRWLRRAVLVAGLARVARVLRLDRRTVGSYLAGSARIGTVLHVERQAGPWLHTPAEALPAHGMDDRTRDPYAPRRPVGEPEPPEGSHGR